MKRRTVFFLSDRTGITAESLGLSLLSQFEDVAFIPTTLPYIDSPEKAKETVKKLEKCYKEEGEKPLVFATIIDDTLREILENAEVYFVDFFNTFLPGLEKTLQAKAVKITGKIHSAHNIHDYNTRIEALNFALSYDDGAKTSDYAAADVILIGVSRSGKTPTSLYLSMQYGIRAANYPLTEEDLAHDALPSVLRPFRHKLFGLTIEAKQLHAIRSGRRPNSRYATLAQCEHEVTVVERMYRQENIPFLSATHLSIEELATKLMVITGLKRNLR